MQIQESKKILW